MNKSELHPILEKIRNENGGALRPADIVFAAEDPVNPLHERFEWDNELAGHQFRLEQARRIIRVVVEKIHPDVAATRSYVSLSTERRAGEGYRPIVETIENEALRDVMLSDALGELQRLETKYGLLGELSALFHEARAIRRRSRGALK